MCFYDLIYDFSARGDKLKEAKSEAERIINAYRAEMEVSYQVSLAKVSHYFLLFIIMIKIYLK